MAKKNQTTFAYPVEKICGKISRNSKIIRGCGRAQQAAGVAPRLAGKGGMSKFVNE